MSQKESREEPRWKIHPPDAETLAMIEASHGEHPRESCDLHRTPTGKCTCAEKS